MIEYTTSYWIFNFSETHNSPWAGIAMLLFCFLLSQIRWFVLFIVVEFMCVGICKCVRPKVAWSSSDLNLAFLLILWLSCLKGSLLLLYTSSNWKESIFTPTMGLFYLFSVTLWACDDHLKLNFLWMKFLGFSLQASDSVWSHIIFWLRYENQSFDALCYKIILFIAFTSCVSSLN